MRPGGTIWHLPLQLVTVNVYQMVTLRKTLCPGSVVHPLINSFKMHICSRQMVKMKKYEHIAAMGQIKEYLVIYESNIKKTGLIYNYGS